MHDYSKLTSKIELTGSGTNYSVLKPDGKYDTLINIEEVQGSNYINILI